MWKRIRNDLLANGKRVNDTIVSNLKDVINECGGNGLQDAPFKWAKAFYTRSQP